MKCKDCIAFGRDYISELCIARHSIEGKTRSEYGCRKHKATIEEVWLSVTIAFFI